MGNKKGEKGEKLEDMFEEMFGTEADKEKPSEEKEEEYDFPQKESLDDPTGLPCDTCGIKVATYSSRYKGQWCVNCWF